MYPPRCDNEDKHEEHAWYYRGERKWCPGRKRRKENRPARPGKAYTKGGGS